MIELKSKFEQEKEGREKYLTGIGEDWKGAVQRVTKTWGLIEISRGEKLRRERKME